MAGRDEGFARRREGGVGGWLEEEEEGWRAEVAESYYLDMLRDTSRNEVYEDGIRRAIHHVRSQAGSQGVGVLDIGTGSGLLAMMARREGAERVTACECFLPVAKSAERCIATNRMDVELVMRASSEMNEGDLKDGLRADILVNELYDTELLGEGILPTLRHALEHLMKPHAIVVPAKADIICQLLQTDCLWGGYAAHEARTAKGTPIFPTPGAVPGAENVDAAAAAAAAAVGIEWQSSHVSISYPSESIFVDKVIERGGGSWQSAPALATTIDFCAPPEHGVHVGDEAQMVCLQNGYVHAVVYWWDLRMCPWDLNPQALRVRPYDDTGAYLPTHLPAEGGKGDRPSDGVLSMAPGEGWRDHWRQNVCVLHEPVRVRGGDVLHVRVVYDDWRVWFEVRKAGGEGGNVSSSMGMAPPPSRRVVREEPQPLGDVRMMFGGNRLRMLRDELWQMPYREVLSKLVTSSSTCIDVGHGHLLALTAAELGAGLAIDMEEQPRAHAYAVESLSAVDPHQTRTRAVHITSLGDIGEQLGLQVRRIDIIMAEPFYSESCAGAGSGGGGTQVENLRLWSVRDALWASGRCSESCLTVPYCARIVGVAAEFACLRSGQKPVSEVMGLNLAPFCEIQPDPDDVPITAYELWMYDWRPLGPEFEILSIDFTNPCGTVRGERLRARQGQSPCQESEGVTLTQSGVCHGVIMWIEYSLHEDAVVSCGPPEDGGIGHHRQMVSFLREEANVVAGKSVLKLQLAEFDGLECELNVRFTVGEIS